MKFLTEINQSSSVNMLTEGEGSDKKHYIKGLFLEFDSPNRNNRIYRSEFHDPVVKNYIKEKIQEGKNAWGELDHPDSPVVSLKNSSHRIVDMWKEGSNWFGKAIILNTPNGDIIKGLLESGGNPGVSSRAMGSVKQLEEGLIEVQRDLKFLTTADVVSDPSAHGALVNGIMENVEWFYDDNLGWITEKVKPQIKKMSLKEIEEKKIKIFEFYMNELKRL